MREVCVDMIRQHVKELFIKSNYYIGNDIKEKINCCIKTESSPIGVDVLKQISENYTIAAEEQLPICQDTGMSIVFLKLGQQVYLTGGNLNTAINDGVREAYEDGYLRKSVVEDPLFFRKNTADNTPAIIHVEIVDGDQIEILVTPKGFGSENMSAVKMLTPADGVQGVKDFVVNVVRNAGSNPCPPIVVGVGIGGTMEKAAIMAKHATTREIHCSNSNEDYKNLEDELLRLINELGIGPAGTGGTTTAIGVNIEYFPTHIAGLPVAVNICCHAARHSVVIL